MLNQLLVIQRKKLAVLTSNQAGSQLPANRYQGNICLLRFIHAYTLVRSLLLFQETHNRAVNRNSMTGTSCFRQHYDNLFSSQCWLRRFRILTAELKWQSFLSAISSIFSIAWWNLTSHFLWRIILGTYMLQVAFCLWPYSVGFWGDIHRRVWISTALVSQSSLAKIPALLMDLLPKCAKNSGPWVVPLRDTGDWGSQFYAQRQILAKILWMFPTSFPESWHT